MQKIEQPPSNKRLSLGIHKKQDWDLIARRGDMAEIFPFWLRQAELVPDSPLKSIGTAQLLSEGKLEHFFHAGFQGILSPRYKDENFLGLVKEIDEPKISPLGLLHEGARQIGRLFFREEEGKLSFLPSLPKQFHAGRFIHLMTKDGDRIDFEWTKKELKKVIIYPAKTHSIQLGLQRSLKSFRVRTNLRARGERCDRNATLELKPNQVLYIDRFTH